MNEIVSIKYQKEYTYFIKFDDENCGNVDFSEYINKSPIFNPLKNQYFFKSAAKTGVSHLR